MVSAQPLVIAVSSRGGPAPTAAVATTLGGHKAASCPIDTAVGASAVLHDAELHMFSLANQDRLRNGLGPFHLDCELVNIARTRATDQVVGGVLSHMDASGGVAVTRLIEESHLSYELIAENLVQLAASLEEAAEAAERALMESPGHRANILNPVFAGLAVGAATNAEGHVVFAQIFVRP